MTDETLDNGADPEISDTDLLSEGKEEKITPADDDKVKEEVDSLTDDEPDKEVEEKVEEETTEEEEETSEEDITRPSWKEIKEKYPEIAKNKEFREVYFREKAYTELFPTLDDAKLAGDKARVLETFDTSLRDGDPTYLIQNLAPKSLEGFANKVLPAIKNLDKDLYLKTTAPFVIDLVNNIQDYAASKGDKNLELSVGNICKWLFGDFKVPSRITTGRVDPEVEREKRNLQEERANLILSHRKDFTGKVERSIDRQLSKLLSEGLGVDNEFLSNSIIEKSITQVKNTIYSDKDFIARVQGLYQQAERAGYSPEYATRVVSAYLGRAKGIALKARAELKASALGKQSPKKVEEVTKRVTRTEKGNNETGKRTDKVNLRSTREISDLEILNRP